MRLAQQIPVLSTFARYGVLIATVACASAPSSPSEPTPRPTTRAALANRPKKLEEITAAYQSAGLSERQAATILLQRFTYGARPDDLAHVLEKGLVAWFADQLAGTATEAALDAKLAPLSSLALDDAELMYSYPSFSATIAHAKRYYPEVLAGTENAVDFNVTAAKIGEFAKAHDLHRMQDGLIPHLYAQKVLRAVYSDNQLREVMTQFWQNHFYVTTTHFGAQGWVMSFERDVLRPHAVGRFQDLLQGSVRHPAVLETFMREAQPVDSATPTLMAMRFATLQRERPAQAAQAKAATEAAVAQVESEYDLILKKEFWAPAGPNPMFAETILRQYTLGPQTKLADGTVQNVAGLLTGWTVFPYGPDARWFAVDLEPTEPLGFKREGSFWFRADQHDAGDKHIFDHDYAGQDGLRAGEQLLEDLALRPETAHHLASKLVQHFVGQDVPAALVAAVAQAFQRSQGDIKAMLTALVTSPEFYQVAADQPLSKTPLHYVASAARSTDADIEDASALVERIATMGQPLYGFLESTGYPQDQTYFLDAGAMLSRIHFAADLQNQAVPGVQVPKHEALALHLASPEFQQY